MRSPPCNQQLRQRPECELSCGEVTGNLIVAICLTCEKKIVVPVQLCVLTTGYVDAPLQQNAVCTTFPSLFPGPVKECEKEHKKKTVRVKRKNPA